MNIPLFLKLFIISYPIFILMDLFWVAYLMSETYHNYIGYMFHIINGEMQLNKIAAFSAWLLIVAGAIALVLPQTMGRGIAVSLAWGAFYGLVIYGFSNLNNLAIFKNWPLTITLIDIAWGMLLNAIFMVLLNMLHTYIR
ncbi:MAG: DUF2177 family protein [Candidatus Babeliales bacterium]